MNLITVTSVKTSRGWQICDPLLVLNNSRSRGEESTFGKSVRVGFYFGTIEKSPRRSPWGWTKIFKHLLKQKISSKNPKRKFQTKISSGSASREAELAFVLPLLVLMQQGLLQYQDLELFSRLDVLLL